MIFFLAVAGAVGYILRMFKVTFVLAASTGTYRGEGFGRSIKAAKSQAESRAWAALEAGDAAVRYVSGIGAEGFWITNLATGKEIFSFWDI